jgi:hypothetical protein
MARTRGTRRISRGSATAARSIRSDESLAPGRSSSPQHTAEMVRRAQPRDPITGAFLRCEPGEIGAHTSHGLRARRVPPEFLALQDRFLAGALVDEGEREADVPTRRRAQVEYRAILHRQILMLDAAFQEQGLFDRKQRLRTAWLQQLVALVGRAESVDRPWSGAEDQARDDPHGARVRGREPTDGAVDREEESGRGGRYVSA